MEETLPYSAYKDRITLIVEPKRDTEKENHRLTLLVNMVIKILYKVLEKQIQQHIEMIRYHDCQREDGSSYPSQQTRNTKHHITIRARW